MKNLDFTKSKKIDNIDQLRVIEMEIVHNFISKRSIEANEVDLR